MAIALARELGGTIGDDWHFYGDETQVSHAELLRRLKVNGTGLTIRQAEDQVIRTLKIPGDFPDEIPVNWTREEMEEFAERLRQIIDTLQTEQAPKNDEEPKHFMRRESARQLLQQLSEKLSGS